MGSANPGKARSAARSASSAPALHISHPHLEQQISCTDPALGKSFGLVLDSKMLKKNQSKKQKLNQPNQMVLANVRSRVPPPGSWGMGVDAVRQPGCSSSASSRQTVTGSELRLQPQVPNTCSAPSVQKPFHGVCGNKGEFNLEDAQREPGWEQQLNSCPGYTKQFVTAHLDSLHCDFLLSIFSNNSSVLLSNKICPSYGENYFLSMDSL